MHDIFNQNAPNQQPQEKIFETANPDTSIDESTSEISEETASTTADKTILEPEGESLNNTDTFSYSNTETNDDTIFNPINFFAPPLKSYLQYKFKSLAILSTYSLKTFLDRALLSK